MTKAYHLHQVKEELAQLQQHTIVRAFGAGMCKCKQDYGGLHETLGACHQTWYTLQFVFSKKRRGRPSDLARARPLTQGKPFFKDLKEVGSCRGYELLSFMNGTSWL